MPRPTNALVVDDEPHVRTFLRLVLKELGIEVKWEASNGAEALAVLEANAPELVLLDLNMPMLGGTGVLERLQQLRPGTPAIVVTSQNAVKTVQDVVKLGAIGYVLKQSPRDVMLKSLRDSLDRIE